MNGVTLTNGNILHVASINRRAIVAAVPVGGDAFLIVAHDAMMRNAFVVAYYRMGESEWSHGDYCATFDAALVRLNVRLANWTGCDVREPGAAR